MAVVSSCHQKFSLITCFVLAVIGLIANPSTAAAQGGPPKLAINIHLHPYLHRVKDDTDLTFTINARLPRRFSYSSFVDIRGVIGDGGASFERSEQNLRWSLPEDLPAAMLWRNPFVLRASPRESTVPAVSDVGKPR